MPVRRVLAKANIADHNQFRHLALHGAGGALHNSVLFPCAGRDLVLLFRQAEQDHCRNSKRVRVVCFSNRSVHREIKDSRHGADFLANAFAGTDEQRIDKILRSKPRFAHHIAQSDCAAQATKTRSREGHGEILAGGVRVWPLRPSPVLPFRYHVIVRPVPNTSARVLEFDSLRDLLLGYANSELGRARVAALAPSSDLGWIRNQQQLAAEIREFRRVGGRFEFVGLTNISSLLEKSRISGAALETLEIREVVSVIDRAAEWREIAFNPPQGMKSDWSGVRRLSSAVADFTDLLRAFRNKILPDGTLDDRASPQLAGIRREIEKQKRAIQLSLQSYLRRLTEGGAAQDE